MKHALITIGKPKSGYVAQGLDDYAKRLKAYGGCAVVHVRAARALKGRSPAEVMAEEGQRLLKQLDNRDVLWALDVKGRGWSSKRWAKELDQTRLSGAPRLVLAVGGAEGLDGAIKARAHKLVSLGPATLPHELAALVALEQLYRAHTILAGTPYHRA